MEARAHVCDFALKSARTYGTTVQLRDVADSRSILTGWPGSTASVLNACSAARAVRLNVEVAILLRYETCARLNTNALQLVDTPVVRKDALDWPSFDRVEALRCRGPQSLPMSRFAGPNRIDCLNSPTEHAICLYRHVFGRFFAFRA